MVNFRLALQLFVVRIILDFNKSGLIYLVIMLCLGLWFFLDPTSYWAEIALKASLIGYALSFLFTLAVMWTYFYLRCSREHRNFWDHLKHASDLDLFEPLLGAFMWPVAWLDYPETLEKNWTDIVGVVVEFWKSKIFRNNWLDN